MLRARRAIQPSGVGRREEETTDRVHTPPTGIYPLFWRVFVPRWLDERLVVLVVSFFFVFVGHRI